MIVVSLVVALALGQSPSYVRSHVKLNQPDSQCLFWTAQTVEWHLNSAGNPQSTDAQKTLEVKAIRSAFQSWQRVFDTCGNLRLVEGAPTDDRTVGYGTKDTQHNVVLFRSRLCKDVLDARDACWDDDTCGNTHDCWEDLDPRTIAITLTSFDEKSGIIYDSDIQLNASSYVFTTVDSPPCVQSITGSTNACVAIDLQNTMTHELGHLIGLDHIELGTSVMYPSAPPGETSKRTIDEGSRSFVCRTYPKGQPSQSCFTPTPQRADGAVVLGKTEGCSSTGAGGWGAALAAGVLLAWRPRREGGRS